MIKLQNKKRFSKGYNRFCYIHPEDKNKILKVLIPEKFPEVKRKKAPYYKKLRPLYFFDDNLRELTAFKNLAKRGEYIWKHFPKSSNQHSRFSVRLIFPRRTIFTLFWITS